MCTSVIGWANLHEPVMIYYRDSEHILLARESKFTIVFWTNIFENINKMAACFKQVSMCFIKYFDI